MKISGILALAVFFAVGAVAESPTAPTSIELIETGTAPAPTSVEEATPTSAAGISTVTNPTAIIQFPVKTSPAGPRTKGRINRQLDPKGRNRYPSQPFPVPDVKRARISRPKKLSMHDFKKLRAIKAKYLGRSLNEKESGEGSRLDKSYEDMEAAEEQQEESRYVRRQQGGGGGPGVEYGGGDLFAPIDTVHPPALFPVRRDHPVPKLGLAGEGEKPVSTNKFYGNFFLQFRNQGTWTHPYMLWWQQFDGNLNSFGISVSHVEHSQKVMGPINDVGVKNYYINPIRIQYFTFGATEFRRGQSDLGIDSTTHMSANVHLYADGNNRSGPKITFPLIQGMGFVTGLYDNLTPVFQSAVFYRKVEKVTAGMSTRSGIVKYRITLEDGRKWLLYLISTDSSFKIQQYRDVNLSLTNSTTLLSTSRFTGIAQVARVPDDADESIWDRAAGGYATTTHISANVAGRSGSYTFKFERGGIPTQSGLLQYALPHHAQALTSNGKTNVKLATTTKGDATLIVADSWTMTENDLPTHIDFAPVNGDGYTAAFSNYTIANITAAVRSDAGQDFEVQTNLNSMYFAGKAFSKFATIAWVASEIVQDRELTNTILGKLKASFAKFVENKQIHPLWYETQWKGVVSSAGYTTNDLGQDFGNTAYNDHHFHYGYHVHAAAIIAFLDKKNNNSTAWLDAHKPYITTLIRDFANPSPLDPYFPVSRAFDWFHGHSWAKGLFESADGKDQESSSEDGFTYYALRMWGLVTGDQNIAQRALLQLGILKRSLNNYYYLLETNKNHPADFVENKVPGILFENKADHTTYFGTEREKIQGIHMIPLTPISVYMRSPQFCVEEWNKWFSGNYVGEKVKDGWKGILMANLALFNPKDAWWYFSQEGGRQEWIDGGASLSWYLAWAAGLGGAPPAE